MDLIVGLGNPGKDYEKNRHNVGFMAADEIFCRYIFSNWQKKFNGEVALGKIDDKKVLLLKPMTFMNLSGNSVIEVVQFYKLEAENILVIHDDLDLNIGKVKAKQGGGPGGHNGLKSIDAALGSNYHRVRIGIGHPLDKTQVSNYVLHDFSKEEKEIISKLITKVADNLAEYFKGGSNNFMNKLSQ